MSRRSYPSIATVYPGERVLTVRAQRRLLAGVLAMIVTFGALCYVAGESDGSGRERAALLPKVLAGKQLGADCREIAETANALDEAGVAVSTTGRRIARNYRDISR